MLTEKPFVTRPEQARELIALARERQRILMVAYQHARLWPYRYAREQIATGKLGEILFYIQLDHPELGERGRLAALRHAQRGRDAR